MRPARSRHASADAADAQRPRPAAARAARPRWQTPAGATGWRSCCRPAALQHPRPTRVGALRSWGGNRDPWRAILWAQSFMLLHMTCRPLRHAAILSVLLLLAACGGAPPYTGGDVADLQRIDVTLGEGDAAAAGDEVSVHYTGWLYDQNAPDKRGAKFDSSRDR